MDASIFGIREIVAGQQLLLVGVCTIGRGVRFPRRLRFAARAVEEGCLVKDIDGGKGGMSYTPVVDALTSG